MTYPMPPQGPRRSPLSSPAVIVAIVAGVLILVGGVIGAFVYATSTSNDATDSASTPSSSQVASPTDATVTVTQTPGTHDPQPPVTQSPSTTTDHSSPSVSGANWQGFIGSDASCNADDAAVFIGYTGRSQVVICQVGSQAGRNYYKGAADGGSIEVGYPTRSGNTFTAENNGTTYQVSPSSLVITESDGTPHVESMVEAWID